jgi:alginate O-acetyltransferase complex protein AlgI
MAIHSLVFIFLFLPIFWGSFLLLPKKISWPLVLLFSLVYYLWLDPFYFPLILVMLVINYLAGRIVAKNQKGWLLLGAVGINLLLLAFFKMLEGNLIDVNINLFGFSGNHSPVGISFFTFTSAAYLFDCYNQRIKDQPGIIKYGVFQMFFSKAIAGPIIRFPVLEKKSSLAPNIEMVASGIRRFTQGLLKKILIADLLGNVVDTIFLLPTGERPMVLAWTGLFFYTLQIFFDFSGYTDMAIGIGQLFGITFPENFNYPYIAKSIGEFWRRWHITLSNWFRDYVFFPLERKRRGIKFWSQDMNVLLVFLLTGLWHGFSVNYLIWGLIHGVAIVLENSKPGQLLREKLPDWMQHIYALAVIIGSWIFFRSPSFIETKRYVRSMLKTDLITADLPVSVFQPIQGLTWAVFALGIVLCTPLPKYLATQFQEWKPAKRWVKPVMRTAGDLFLLATFVFAIGVRVESTFSSFLYGNF